MTSLSNTFHSLVFTSKKCLRDCQIKMTTKCACLLTTSDTPLKKVGLQHNHSNLFLTMKIPLLATLGFIYFLLVSLTFDGH